MPDKRKKLKRYSSSLRTIRAQLEQELQKNHGVIGRVQMEEILTEVRALAGDFPEVVIPFDPARYARRSASAEPYFDLPAIVAYLARLIPLVEAEVEEEEVTPVTERRLFPFMKNDKLREIVERDDFEITRSAIAECWKSVIILAGGAIEGVLLDLLLQHEQQARTASGAPGGKELMAWDLGELIRVAKALKLVPGTVDRLSDVVRDYRNLVHPGKEVREEITFGKPEARVAMEVLTILHRERSA